jgi:nitrogen fixation NifU-like protein
MFSGKVYNLEVEGAHSYTTSCGAVHNCGDVMEVYVSIKDNKVVDAKFKTFGCCAAIAASDAVCELVKGRTVDEALKLAKQDIVDFLGELPALKIHCSVLGIDALKAAIKDYQRKKE